MSPREEEMAGAMKALLGLESDGDLIRTALYGLTDHAGLNPDINLFALRAGERQIRRGAGTVWRRAEKRSTHGLGRTRQQEKAG